MTLPFKHKLMVVAVVLSIYTLGFLLQKQYLTDTAWIYFVAFWLGNLCAVIEKMVRDKFTETQLNKLRYFMPKS